MTAKAKAKQQQLKNTIDDLVFVIHKKFEKVVGAHDKLVSARIEAGHALLELRGRVEAGEIGRVKWWDWYGTKFKRSRRDAERVMALAEAEDPQAAQEAERAKSRHRPEQPTTEMSQNSPNISEAEHIEEVETLPFHIVPKPIDPSRVDDTKLERVILVIKGFTSEEWKAFLPMLRKISRERVSGQT